MINEFSINFLNIPLQSFSKHSVSKSMFHQRCMVCKTLCHNFAPKFPNHFATYRYCNEPWCLTFPFLGWRISMTSDTITGVWETLWSSFSTSWGEFPASEMLGTPGLEGELLPWWLVVCTSRFDVMTESTLVFVVRKILHFICLWVLTA